MANSYPAFVDPAAGKADAERGALLKPLVREIEEAHPADRGKVVRERDRLFAEHRLPPVPLSTFVDHVIRLVEIGGEEHAGIGTDFDGIPDTLEGFEDPSRFPGLTAALLARGVDKAGVRLILGENFLRVLHRAERLAF